MRLPENIFGRRDAVRRSLEKGLALGAAMVCLAGCVLEPYPPPPPPPVVAAPAPQAYYATPCCYAYPQYPPYYAYGPAVNVGVGFGGGYRHWR